MSDKPVNNGDANLSADGGGSRREPDEDAAATRGDEVTENTNDPEDTAHDTPVSDADPAAEETPVRGAATTARDIPVAGMRDTDDERDEADRNDDTSERDLADDDGEKGDDATAATPPPGDTPSPGSTDEPAPADATKPVIIPPEDDKADEDADEPGGVRLAAAASKDAPGKPAKAGKKTKKPQDRRIKYARRAAYVLGVLVLLPIIGFIVVYLMTPVPSSAQPTAKAQQSVFYYNDGKTVIARTGDFDRRPIDLKAVPPQVRDAVISAENRSFYSDSGVSVKGSARAVWATLTGGSMQGGSTITQQMVRNYYSGLSQQRTAGRKLKEIMVALKVSREKNKDWILQQYLNTIYFGREAYGIESAAQAYYGKDVQQLTPAEGAYLAAAIQVPTYAGDLTIPGAQGYMQARWQYVVSGMVQMGAISQQQAATMKFPPPAKQKQKSIYAGDKGYMVSQAKAELRRMGYTDNQINMGGLKVRTTFDKDLMAAARQAVKQNMPSGTSKKILTGLVSIDPDNGEINAFYGGKDYVDQQFNNAFDAKVQAGSGFKPYVLAAALADGESLNTYVDGSSPQRFAGVDLQNDNNENFGMVNLVTATQDSINTAYLNLGQKVGLGKVVSMAEKVGIPAAQLEPHKDAATLPLGVADVSVQQQAAGYATFASEGVYHAPHVIRSVTAPGSKPRKVSEPGKRVFSTTVARDATYAMQKVVDAGTGTNAGLPDRNAAGKTGTTSDGKQLWFNGFIPQLTASVGIFRSDNKPLVIPGYSSYGGDLPARIWRSYVVQADQALHLPPKSFGAPSVYTGGGGRSTTVPVNPRPHPTGSRPPAPPTSGPTDPVPPPVDPPGGGNGGGGEPPTDPPPTGGTQQRGLQRHGHRIHNLSG
ncbi:transglycosylase domain-containing protein [Actinoallomurus sp. CA-142502]|uniref:transglycosylase domain-containing protein n=1 Tax=Actinoallomurus sp. CA-142502 TaxID=3239885 RepID=UPI003D913A6A